jgi:hypothetical protein
MQLEVPAGTSASIELPPAGTKPWTKIYLYGELHWTRAAGDRGGAPQVEVEAGRHELRAER